MLKLVVAQFQFHKGTIKTRLKLSTPSFSVISIP